MSRNSVLALPLVGSMLSVGGCVPPAGDGDAELTDVQKAAAQFVVEQVVAAATTYGLCGALSDAQRGVSVLNDCKHGYDVKDGVVRLTPLRSSYDPDPQPDVGTHHMRYAAVPHTGPLDKAATARAAWAFNRPLDVLVLETAPEGGTLPSAWSGCEAAPANIIVTAVTCAEDNDDFIIRAYECAGQTVMATITLGFAVQSAIENDFLECAWQKAGKVTVAGRTITAEFKPYEIRTLRVGR
ncbi:MAG TPA: glycosyl hydrolase-related protein [Phycisphaerae bacterium]|nr:glycosyl hydrolase-related protein [Phycisphaerae bacterium]